MRPGRSLAANAAKWMFMPDNDIVLKRIRGFHVGGRRRRITGFDARPRSRVPGDAPVAIDMNGDHMVGQLYAKEYLQSDARFALPVLLWHGGGLSGACWEDTPEGGAGWLDYFLRDGCDVVVSDAFERGRASFPPYPQFLSSPPEHRSLEAVWHHFRFGPGGSYPDPLTPESLRARAYPGQQFPVESLEQFGRQFVPRWAGTDEFALRAYAELLEKIGPCVVIGHSQGGSFALECARRHPDLVRAVVAVEPAAAPAGEPGAGGAPHLFVWGDRIDDNPTWVRYRDAALRYKQRLQAQGVRADWLSLPDHGVGGNSHMLIMDRNNQAIAAMVGGWLRELFP